VGGQTGFDAVKDDSPGPVMCPDDLRQPWTLLSVSLRNDVTPRRAVDACQPRSTGWRSQLSALPCSPMRPCPPLEVVGRARAAPAPSGRCPARLPGPAGTLQHSVFPKHDGRTPPAAVACGDEDPFRCDTPGCRDGFAIPVRALPHRLELSDRMPLPCVLQARRAGLRSIRARWWEPFFG
jgi:hypothetical protein